MKKVLTLLFVLVSAISFATHNRAGEITYKRITPFTEEVGGVTVPAYNYSITIVVYNDFCNQCADRCSLDTVYFGDGQVASVPRMNGNTSGCGCFGSVPCGEILSSDPNYLVKKSIYTVVHRYANAGNYLIRVGDPNRNGGVYNIQNSINQAFYIEALLVINNFTGANTSPQFNYPPIDKACRNKCFYHNPGAYDPDGDSLSYELTVCRGNAGAPVIGYTYPSGGIGGTFNIDQTGLITWCTPQVLSQFNIAFIIREWRKNSNGVYELVGYVLRDMQIIVESCPVNEPPLVTVPPDTCVEAGALIAKKIRVSDPNAGDFVMLSGEGGAFAATSPKAILDNASGTITAPNGSFYADFRWQTTCDHVRRQPYATVFKAKDNGNEQLVHFATYNIRVLPPSVKNVTAVPIGANIRVSWSPVNCNPSTNPLTTYKVYRKDDCSAYTYTPCQTGIPVSSGFSLIGQTTASEISFTDDNSGNGLIVGQNYSYLVVGVYADGTETYGSSQVCTKLKRDAPLMLNVDVVSTATNTGAVYIKWTRPLVSKASVASSEEVFDTLAFPGPYVFNLKYRLTASGGSGAFSDVQSFSSVYFLGLDTTYLHTGLNTVESGLDYKVEFQSLGFPNVFSVSAKTFTDTPETVAFTSSSQTASSIFIETSSSDRRVDLKWSSKTPWKNKKYAVWRKEGALTYQFLDSTKNTSYVDTHNVVNKREYCYKVIGIGEYSDTSIYRPLLNWSQESCSTPIDLTPPCLPTPTITATCPDMQEGSTTISNNGSVRIDWNDVRAVFCGGDVSRYDLFYKPTPEDSYKKIKSGLFSTYINDTLQYIAGCYAIQALDSNGNISPMSIDYCVDNCPVFELPNVFTPNNDNTNDFFQAIRVRQIKEIDLYVYDRWGNLVYETKDPRFKWNGVSIHTNQPVSDGALFYICDVYEPRLRGLIKRSLKGYVQVFR
ncbi:MAG: gliding motility-associated C-terminal domain-containing protein [Bacteroidetes bacterium]|nr:gliding motility-associated C-terminal domain-containing protein [Bacteroidota bacterium]